MREIYVFDDRDNYTARWLRSLVWAEEELRDLGFSVKFHSGKTLIPRRIYQHEFVLDDLSAAVDKLKKLDIVFLAFHWTRKFFETSDEDIIKVLQKLRKKCNLLVWLDTGDSTGTTRFQYIPFVDLYLKKQVLKDRRRYLTEIWGGKIQCEYYHEMLGIDDPEVHKGEPFLALQSEEDLEKLRISWNVGCSNWSTGNMYMQLFHPYNFAHYDFMDPKSGKEIDAHFRGSAHSPIAGYQRKRTIELLEGVKGLNIPNPRKRVPNEEYNRELRSTKLVCSPFGWGEICTRDFEAFVYGAALVKPSMEHMDTFPQWFIPNETYIPVKWDFSDFTEIIESVKEPAIQKHYLDIAIHGQEMFRNFMTTREGRQEFAKHLADMLVP